MNVLVIGGTGKVGTILVRHLVAAGVDVRVLTRSAARAGSLPRGTEAAVANITQDPDAAAKAFEGAGMVFMLNQPSLEEMTEGLLAVHLARLAGVGRFVYQSVHNAEKMGHIPHVAAKLAIERSIRSSGMRWTILRPNYFYQNDLPARSALERGRYAMPIGKIGVAAVDAGDIAAAAAATLLESGHEGKTYNLAGPDVLTGDICSAVWAKALGRDVRDVGDVAAWRDATRTSMPPWFNYDLAMMYAHLEASGMLPDPTDLEVITSLLGRPPRSYRDFVLDQVESWNLPAAAA